MEFILLLYAKLDKMCTNKYGINFSEMILKHIHRMMKVIIFNAGSLTHQ